MSAIDHLIHANGATRRASRAPARCGPKLRLTVVTCMDSRLDLFGALGLDIGDAHLLRNAGGVITDDVLRSLAISQRALGTREIVILHHTDCGMDNFDDAAFRPSSRRESGGAAVGRARLHRRPRRRAQLDRGGAGLPVAAAP